MISCVCSSFFKDNKIVAIQIIHGFLFANSLKIKQSEASKKFIHSSIKCGWNFFYWAFILILSFLLVLCFEEKILYLFIFFMNVETKSTQYIHK